MGAISPHRYARRCPTIPRDHGLARSHLDPAHFGMTFDNPDFVKYTEAYGGRGTRVRAVGELRSTLQKGFAGGGVHLVIVPIDYSENKRVLVDELRQRLTVAPPAPSGALWAGSEERRGG